MNSTAPAISSLKAGRYQVYSVLGTGGFGITYLCRDARTGHLCAVKEYMPEQIASRDCRTKDILPDPERKKEYLHGKKRFCEEAAYLSKMQQMTGIVHILDLFEEHNTAYYVMDYIEGKNLKQLVKERGGKLPFPEAVAIIVRAACAMERVHQSAGIFHRDLSPENIMVMSDGTVHIIDFGSAKMLSRNQDQQYSIVLKPGFAPPEQYSSEMKQGSYSDVYALASTFYYIATGQKIPSAPSRLAGEKYTPLKQMVPECKKGISEALDRALRLDPARRTQTMTELIDDLCGKGCKKLRPEYGKEGGNTWEKREEKPKQNMPDVGKKRGISSETDQEQPEQSIPDVWLLVERGFLAGQLFPIREDRWVSVGRNPGRSEIVISGHGEISGIHFFVRYDAEKHCFYLYDRSTNGCYYRGKRLGKNRIYTVEDGTRLLIGGSNCSVVLGETYAKK